MELVVRVPGSCGELLQGWDEKGEPFLLTCPINRYASLTICDDGKGERRLGEKGLRALQAVLDFLHLQAYPYSLYQTDRLPQGKGMASSSADISAVIIGVAKSLGYSISTQDVMTLAASIEPTDGVSCPGLCQLNYLTGTIGHIYPVVPAIRIALVDTGGTIDTLAFHRRHDMGKGPLSQGLEFLRHQPWSAVNLAKAATYSALANQAVLYKQDVPLLYERIAAMGALGLNVAHSGTVIGILFPAAMPEALIARQVRAALRQMETTAQYKDTVSLISGGSTVTYR